MKSKGIENYVHQGQLCTHILKIYHSMKNVASTVNFIRSKGLNYIQSQIGSEHDDIIYVNNIRWLSRSATLS